MRVFCSRPLPQNTKKERTPFFQRAGSKSFSPPLFIDMTIRNSRAVRIVGGPLPSGRMAAVVAFRVLLKISSQGEEQWRRLLEGTRDLFPFLRPPPTVCGELSPVAQTSGH